MSASEKALRYSKSLGISECEVVYSEKKITTLRITDSDIAEIKQNYDECYGIRLIHQKKILTSQTNNSKNLEKIIDELLKMSSHLKPKNFWSSLPHNPKTIPSIKGLCDKKLSQISGKQAADIAQEMINSASDDKINSISGSLNIVSESFQIINSNGLDLTDNATYISGIINADSEKGKSPVSGIGHGSCRTLEKFSATQIGADSKTMCIESINPKKCECDTYSIIFEPYSVGELLAFVFSTNFNLKIFSEKKSCFSNNFEKKIAVEEFSLIDDPHVPEGIGSKPFDDEGIITNPNPLINQGVFCGVFSDSYNAFKENKQSSANAARPGSPMGRSAQAIPVPTPHNLKVSGGDMSHEEIIKDTKKGLIVGRLWYTYAVNPIKGDFSCTARSGIKIIENGEIKNSARPVRIIHNLPMLLQNISAIGNNPRNVIQWASLPSITPSIRVEKIKVNPI